MARYMGTIFLRGRQMARYMVLQSINFLRSRQTARLRVPDFYATDLVIRSQNTGLKKEKSTRSKPNVCICTLHVLRPYPPPARAPRPLFLSLRPVWYALSPTRSTNCPKSFDRKYSSLSPSSTGRSQSNRRPPRSAPCQCPLCIGFGAPAACR